MIKAIIFDLGNVLLNFDHQIIFERLGKYLPSPDILRWAGRRIKRLVTQFEMGDISADAFYEQLGLAVKFDGLGRKDFDKKWAEIFWKNDELVALLDELSGSIELHMLSNTNSLHVDYARQAFPEVFTPFSNLTLSYEVGTAKPAKEIFEHALQHIDAKPEETIYFDDIQKYVASARRLGINAHQYVSVDGVRDVCRMYDIKV